MRNAALEQLEVLVGTWQLTLTNAFFLESMETKVQGAAKFEWLEDAFLVMRSEMGGKPTWDIVFGRSDPNEAYLLLYHDERGVSRVFRMTFGDGQWTLLREDPDFYQRFIADVQADRISGRWEMSGDKGKTWRKDFDLIFERKTSQ